MSVLYGVRSIIVHGLKKTPKFYTCIQNLGNYEEIVRRAIRVFIDTMKLENWDHQGMMDKLDYDKRDIYEIDIGKMDWKAL